MGGRYKWVGSLPEGACIAHSPQACMAHFLPFPPLHNSTPFTSPCTCPPQLPQLCATAETCPCGTLEASTTSSPSPRKHVSGRDLLANLVAEAGPWTQWHESIPQPKSSSAQHVEVLVIAQEGMCFQWLHLDDIGCISSSFGKPQSSCACFSALPPHTLCLISVMGRYISIFGGNLGMGRYKWGGSLSEGGRSIQGGVMLLL